MYNFNEEAIREAAYYIWKNNGCRQGTALSDWDEAIHQLSVNAAFATKMSKKSSNCKKSATSCKKTTKTTSTLKNVKSIVLNPISAFKATAKK